MGYFTSSLTVFLRDIPQSLGVILNVWFYLTPIVYPVEKIPEQWQFLVFWCNPLTAIAEFYRDLILTGEVTHWMELGIASITSTVIFYIGFFVYQKLRPAFADVL